MKMKIVVFYGSVRSGRQGIRAARFVVNQLTQRGHGVALIDPLEYQLPLLDKMYKEFDPGKAPELLQKMADRIIPADAYVVVSGEYNHSVPPALANLLDHFLDEYFYKPSAIVCYSAGSFGGVRASIALRPMLAEMGMSSIPSVFPVPKVQNAFSEEGVPTDEKTFERAKRFFDELEWYAGALKVARSEHSNRD
jgi:NAD(P)H-dependent FMN reductase